MLINVGYFPIRVDLDPLMRHGSYSLSPLASPPPFIIGDRALTTLSIICRKFKSRCCRTENRFSHVCFVPYYIEPLLKDHKVSVSIAYLFLYLVCLSQGSGILHSDEDTMDLKGLSRAPRREEEQCVCVCVSVARYDTCFA